METLPGWIWLIYYFVLLVTFGTTMIFAVKNKMLILSLITLIITGTLPIFGLVNSIGRNEHMNEWELLVIDLQDGAIWAIYSILGYVWIGVWWVVFFIYLKRRA
jgi:hypothetical protein